MAFQNQWSAGIFHTSITLQSLQSYNFISNCRNAACEEMSLDVIRHHQGVIGRESHDLCTCTTAARSKQTSAAGSAASKETTSRRFAGAGCSWCTYWHFKEPTVSENTNLQSKFATKGPPPALISGSGCTLYFLQIFKYIVCSCPTYFPIKLSISSLGEDRSIKSMTKACHSTSFTSPYLSAKHHFARIVLLVDLDHTLFVCLIGVRFKGKSTSS